MEKKNLEKRRSSYRLALGVQIAKYGRILPPSIYDSLADAAERLGLKITDFDVERQEQPDSM